MFNDIPSHRPPHETRKFPLDPFGCHAALEQLEILRIINPDIDVRRIAFVTGARMRNIAHENPFVALAVGSVTKISKVRSPKWRLIRTDLVSTGGVFTPRSPPPPAGPQHK